MDFGLIVSLTCTFLILPSFTNVSLKHLLNMIILNSLSSIVMSGIMNVIKDVKGGGAKCETLTSLTFHWFHWCYWCNLQCHWWQSDSCWRNDMGRGSKQGEGEGQPDQKYRSSQPTGISHHAPGAACHQQDETCRSSCSNTLYVNTLCQCVSIQ